MADIDRIERVRLDPSTTFPTTVRLTREQIKHRYFSVERPEYYDVALERGPFTDEADAWKVEEEETTKEQTAAGDGGGDGGGVSNGDEPDMSAFVSKRRLQLKLRRKLQTASAMFSEFIVYDTKQIRLKYLIELTSENWVKRDFERREDANRKAGKGNKRPAE
eukprot:CAMPEP_0198725728 /NCGR_PEP_ID=MMETSP1475-20131203/2982_1 /TAXON_ID= ORGANISM="Unidentified sp., Strain CCMP1999" /NCGR_SAMPLE_ID=MMETSP1475 /ASSEMBLY_ACC=CAM_ASM_001111 /LENGTH=162 /DNA_ID=CAMNT_0044487549 /DNA_START=36 /DNA_END=524 /DNA_ORIENTATION=+